MSKWAAGCAALLLLGACNAILGNEDNYRLDTDTIQGGAPGTAGSLVNVGGSKAGTAAAGKPSTGGSNGGNGGSVVGEAGGGGEPACDAAAAEDCFNGFDDDCNGDIDCEDPACDGPAECVTVPAGAELGLMVDDGMPCPTGYSALTLHQGLTADPQCTGCSCISPDSYCDASIVGLICPFQISGNSYNLFSTSCQPVAPANGPSLRIYSIRGFTECDPSGTAAVSKASWSATKTFCKIDELGKGCLAGSRCAPTASPPACSLRSGKQTCAGDYPTSTGDPWSTDLVDERTCPACQCAFGGSACTGGKIRLYSAANCSGTMAEVGGPADVDNCNLGFTPVSGTIVGTPASNTCEPNTYTNGKLEPTDVNTICCH